MDKSTEKATKKTAAPSVDKSALTDRDFYQQACSYFYYHAEQRTTMINYFIAVFGASIALYGTLLEKYTLASILIGAFAAVVSVLFYMIDVRNRFDVKMSQCVICQIERDYNVDKPNGDYAYGVFSNEDHVFEYYENGSRRKNKDYKRLRTAYRKARRGGVLPQELIDDIDNAANENPYISAKALADSMSKGSIAHLSTCIQWLYFVCMVISALAVALAVLIAAGLL